MEPTVNETCEVWRERITAQRASGQSIRAWCRENGQHEYMFYSWRSKLGLSPQPGLRRQRRRIVRQGFAEVVLDRPASEPAGLAEPIRLLLCGGRELLLPASMPMERVAKLAALVEASQ
jgi:hypothetical protein